MRAMWSAIGGQVDLSSVPAQCTTRVMSSVARVHVVLLSDTELRLKVDRRKLNVYNVVDGLVYAMMDL